MTLTRSGPRAAGCGVQLYRGAETVREVGWVIFDEVHYMRDRERGVVWEESIVLIASLLPGASMVFLSATLSNAHEFAEWVANLTARPCHVVSAHAFVPIGARTPAL